MVLALLPQLAPCPTEQFGQGAECGSIQVAENPDRPGGRKIPIRFVVLRAKGQRLPEPVLLFNGGPGAASTDMAQLANGPFGPIRQERDFLLVDQRGTGGSYPLMCVAGVRERPALAFGHLYQPAYAEKCRKDLERTADLTRYTTDRVVEDLEQVRRALGYERLILWGGSFGTRVAQAYARRHPDRVRAMILDGVVPFDFTAPLTYAMTLQQSLDRVLASCRGRRACQDSFPNLDAEWRGLVQKVREGPVRVRVTPPGRPPVEVDMHLGDFGYAVRGILYRADQSRRLPAMIHAAATTGDLSEFAQRYWGRAADFEEDFAEGLHLAVFCSEETGFIRDADLPAATRGSFLGSYLIDEYRGACKGWPRAAMDSSFRRPMEAPVPTLLVSGYYDPVTPPEMGDRVARHLKLQRHIVDSAAHHGASFGCARPAVMQVLSRGALEGLPAVCGLASRAVGQTTPCLSHADSVEVRVAQITQTVTAGDSARLVNQGLPYRPPEGVRLVTDAQTCQAMIAAFNGLYPASDSAKHITQAYVLRVGTSVFSVVPENVRVYYYFDSSGSWLAGILQPR